jgi:hypothetical protein
VLVSQQIDPAYPYEAVFTLGTRAPLHLWVSPCPQRGLGCGDYTHTFFDVYEIV